MPGTVLATGDIAVNKNDVHVSCGTYILMKGRKQ